MTYTTGWTTPGSLQRNGSMMAYGPESGILTDCVFERYATGGLIKFDDGTIWMLQCESRGANAYNRGATLFEWTPGSPVWEMLTGDYWATNPNTNVAVDGTEYDLCDWILGPSTNWVIANDGDAVWLVNTHTFGPGMAFVNRDRTFVWYDLDSYDQPEGYPVFQGEYIYWISVGGDLMRAFRNDPSTLTSVMDISGYVGAQHTMAVYEDRWLYIVQGGNGGSSIMRFDTTDFSIDTLYEWGGWRSITDIDGTVEQHLHLPIGTGIYPYILGQSRILDGWLYWMDESSERSVQGQFFNRISLVELWKADVEGVITHDPTRPLFEVLSNGSAASESFARWGPYEGGLWMIGQREGGIPIYGRMDQSWFFDDEGGIVFSWTGFPAYNHQGDDDSSTSHISRLLPAAAFQADVKLLFEGNELKGYGHVNELQEKTVIPTIELVR